MADSETLKTEIRSLREQVECLERWIERLLVGQRVEIDWRGKEAGGKGICVGPGVFLTDDGRKVFRDLAELDLI
jgi:hypothetical protein